MIKQWRQDWQSATDADAQPSPFIFAQIAPWPDHDVGMITGIRTVIAYFLNKEVEDCEHELENDEQGNVTI